MGREGRDSALLFAFCAGSNREATEKDLVILQKKVAGLDEGTLDRFVLRARKAVGLRGQVNVLVTSSAAVRSLNRRFRSQNKVTDVLSFPFTSPAVESRKRPQLTGEIAISADIALQNSARLGHSVAQEIKILALHGILHLAGFDHERDNGEMASKEATLRRALRLPAALIERVEIERVEIERVQIGRVQRAKLERGASHATGARSMA
jgi:probable rRNA maturation factor